MNYMISVEFARELILETCRSGKRIAVPAQKALGFVLGEPVSAPASLPAFDQSAMDGYAFRIDDLKEHKTLRLAGIAAAGKTKTVKVSKGEAIRIFTGAVIPPGADTVVMQENTEVINGVLSIRVIPPRGANIRLAGSQIKKGEVALPTGTLLGPAAIGFVASMGITKLKIFARPRIHILVNGNELKRSGVKIKKGEIHESNSLMLESALHEMNVRDVKKEFCPDNPVLLLKKVKKALKECDILLLTGGISVGDYDFTRSVLQKAGVDEVFYKVKQKPGKPLCFGTKNKKLIFALPGNPAAALTCFYEYVKPAVYRVMGLPSPPLPALRLPLIGSYSKKKGLTHFLKGIHDGKQVRLTVGQESFILRSFAEANCLVCIPEDCETVLENADIEVHPL
ncbi:MAG: molybdopterin molybdotransferase MoeA [Bacteroidia bacterium]|nr:molybdopterin molybdotransferase MoeA [Bacteroidia bacterium]